MRLATTTEDFDPYFSTYTELIEYVAKAGFKYIDLSMYVVHPDDALLISDNWKETVSEIKKCADRLGVKFVQAHSPGGRMFLDDHTFNEDLFKKTVRSVEVCAELGIPNLVVHAGFWKGMTEEEFFEQNKWFYSRLLKEAEPFGVNILVENSAKDFLGFSYCLTTGEDMRRFIEYVDHPLLHACWDTGHANIIAGPQYDNLMTLGEHLYALHINDNRGNQDEHSMPYMGTINLDEIISALIDLGFKGYFTFESCRLLRPANCWIGDRRKFAKDTRLADPSAEMHLVMERAMYEIGKYALSAYDIFEE